MITDFGMDLDGVVYDFASPAVWAFSQVMGQELPEPTHWHFYEDWGLTSEQFYMMLDEITKSHELFDIGSPVLGTLRGWKMLKELGVRIHVITHRSPSAYTQTTRWLERHNLVPDTLHFTDKKAEVLSALTPYGGEAYAVDDCADFYTEYHDNGIDAFLFDRPWNRGFPAKRVNSLIDVAEKVGIYNRYHGVFDTDLYTTELF